VAEALEQDAGSTAVATAAVVFEAAGREVGTEAGAAVVMAVAAKLRAMRRLRPIAAPVRLRLPAAPRRAGLAGDPYVATLPGLADSCDEETPGRNSCSGCNWFR